MTDDDPIRRAVHELVRAAPHPKELDTSQTVGPRRWLAVAASAVVLVGGAATWWAASTDSTSVSSETRPTVTLPSPDTPSPSVIAPPTSASSTSPSTTPSAATIEPTTTVPTPPFLPTGTFDLGPDDLIARQADGDVRLYPGALGDEPDPSIVVIDRADPRPVPDEGEGPNFIDSVAGTHDGTLIYSDCCEPVSGNIFAITEPGAEADIWDQSAVRSERARLWGVGFGAMLEPGGTRVLASSWDFVNVVDVATGAQSFVVPSGGASDEASNMTGEPFGALGASWTPSGMIVVVGWADDRTLVLTEHDPDDLRVEIRRLVLDPVPTDRTPRVGFVDLGQDLVSVVLYGADDNQVIGIDTGSFQVVDAAGEFAAPPEATMVRHSLERDAWLWIVDETAYIQVGQEAPVMWQSGIADAWFPTVIATEPRAVDTSPCQGGGSDEDEDVARLAHDIVTARRTGEFDPIVNCFTTPPSAFTNVPPACWADCDGWTQTIADTPVYVSTSVQPGSEIAQRGFVRYVSYQRGDKIIDVTESWTLSLTESGVEIEQISFEDPVSSRGEGAETLGTYLGHVRDGNWLGAAEMLDDGAINPEERRDLARLDLADFSLESIAAALQVWCADGCVTDPPQPEDLTWDGLYGMTRDDEQVRVAWYEGYRSIVGLPIRTASPTRTP